MEQPEEGKTGLVPVTNGELRFLRIKEVLKISGKSRASVYEAIKRGEFPAPVKLSGTSSGWVKAEIDLWAQECINARPKSGKSTGASS